MNAREATHAGETGAAAGRPGPLSPLLGSGREYPFVTLDQKGVGLGKFSPKAPKGLAAKVQKIKAQIIAGKIKNIPTTVK